MNLGFPEIAILLLVALLLFGPRKLPELARSLGEAIGELKSRPVPYKRNQKPLDNSPCS
ncbi:MAG: twin-arginine translocase TatA/TatE family subunit [Meiothermus sp.]|jgi:sec-independent protein translocase protein TatA|nr:twin-arginine translocase TatA/TatE family subunit [Meiothermus sp.]